ncbi:MAG: NTPase [Planctomycetes bacterium GWF2_41_51]|nr:MAG: NTPase [Planctomycetes bacterium GWF2_41_51]HBG27619.1 NTPase [Phycisphaerales bacterium]
MWKDSETIEDFLDFEYLKETFKSIAIEDTLSPSSIGIYGDWGSGKSSLMKMCMEELSQKENVLCVFFNGWLFEGYEDAKTALLGTILDSIKKERKLEQKAVETIKRLYKNTDKLKLASKAIRYGVDFLATGGIGTIANITLDSVLSTVKDKVCNIKEDDVKNALSGEFNNEEIRNSVRTFHDDFSKLLSESKITKLIVFIDELDRCNPNTILDTLEAIRLFLFSKNTSFVIGADERHVKYAVKQKFLEIEGNQLDIGKEYLEKLIQYPIRIPQMSQKEIEFYIMCLLFQKELEQKDFEQVLSFIKNEKKNDFINFELTYNKLAKEFPTFVPKLREAISIAKQLSSVLASGLNGNPRHCKRFLNSLSMREKMAKYRKIKLDRKILAKVMLLEYFKMDFFRKIAEIKPASKGEIKELQNIENGKWEETKELNLWKDDNWIKDWVKIEPKIGQTDLRPYFYFTRESLTNQLNLAQLKLSLTAEKILSNLLNGSEIARNAAMNEINEANESEANTILIKIAERLTSSANIDGNIFKSLLAWGASRVSLYVGTINCLNELTGEKLNIGVIPRMKDFMDHTNKKAEITEIVNRWKKENPSLKQAIEKDFGNGNIK